MEFATWGLCNDSKGVAVHYLPALNFSRRSNDSSAFEIRMIDKTLLAVFSIGWGITPVIARNNATPF